MEIEMVVAVIVIAGMGLISLILPFKMIRDIRRAVAGECYENCMQAFHWEPEEAPACIRDCRLQEA